MVNIIKAIKIGLYGENITRNHFPFNSILKLGKILVKVFKNYKKNLGKKIRDDMTADVVQWERSNIKCYVFSF